MTYSLFPHMKLQFLSSQNKIRFPTADAVFSEYEGLEVESAGLYIGAENL